MGSRARSCRKCCTGIVCLIEIVMHRPLTRVLLSIKGQPFYRVASIKATPFSTHFSSLIATPLFLLYISFQNRHLFYS